MLAALESADDLQQVQTVPGWRLHPLNGDRKGEYSMTVSGNWRLVFRVDDRLVTDIDFVDYH
jgi:proteic killer suppression protein